MNNKSNCKWCGFSYTDVKQGQEYLYHEEQSCELQWLRKTLKKLLIVKEDHMTACDRTMGATHPCTCGADIARKLIE